MLQSKYEQQINQLLADLNVPTKDRELMIESIYQNLKSRVGIRLVSQLNDQQLNQLEKAFMNDDEFFLDHIDQMVPNIDQIFEQELNGIQQELLDNISE
jgi:hypothetical protein